MEFLWDWLGWIVAGITGIFAIRGTVKFDINLWLKERREQKEKSLAKLCPHVRISKENGLPAIIPAHISPSGTHAWICQMCGQSTHDERAIEDNSKYWASNLKLLDERYKKIQKIRRKLGME